MRYSPLLLNKLYTCETLSDDGTVIYARIRLLEDHPVFAGHFPGNPVLPGVCVVQIIKELVSGARDQLLQLARAGNIKYSAFIQPQTHPYLVFEIRCLYTEGGRLSCTARVSDQHLVFCSFRGEFTAADHGSNDEGIQAAGNETVNNSH